MKLITRISELSGANPDREHLIRRMMQEYNPELEKFQTDEAKKRANDNAQLAKVKATEEQWEMCRRAILAFQYAYPKGWQKFQLDMAMERMDNTPFQESKASGLKDVNWRKTASFPVVYVLKPDGEYRTESLLPTLQKIIPGLTHKYSVNYVEFLKRFPFFVPGEKVGAQTFSDSDSVQAVEVERLLKEMQALKPKKTEVKKKRGRKKKND